MVCQKQSIGTTVGTEVCRTMLRDRSCALGFSDREHCHEDYQEVLAESARMQHQAGPKPFPRTKGSW